MSKTYHSPIYKYTNGNYTVTLYEDGTKIKRTLDDTFEAQFPDSIDLKITNYCDKNCPMCHEDSSTNGKHGDLCVRFLDTLHAGTELAIGGGNPLSHPNLEDFLKRMKSRDIVCNLTVNEMHFLQNRDLIEYLLREKLIYGLGISIATCEEKTLVFAEQNTSVILHIICGLVDEQTLQKMSNRHLKVLLLGYKKHGRGAYLYSPAIVKNIGWLKENLHTLASKFSILCFDNLALSQLNVKKQISEQLFDESFMGEDGTGSMYIDIVKGEYAVSSVSNVRYPLGDSIDQMFGIIKNSLTKTSQPKDIDN